LGTRIAALARSVVLRPLGPAERRPNPEQQEKHIMATATRKPASKAATKTASRSASSGPGPDATALLRADHKRVSALFEQYETTRSQARKKAVVATICTELSVHAQVEEEIFYPAVKAALRDKELVPEATVEHATLKELIAQVQDKEPDGEMFDAKIKVMSEYVKHHVKEEQNEMFPKARASRLDMNALGAQIAARKEELMASQPPAGQKPGQVARLADVVA
jgi:hemerythrin superfamily protein